MITPAQAAMAKGLQAQRGGAPPPDDMMTREAPPAKPSGIEEIKAHLTAAMELLDGLGG